MPTGSAPDGGPGGAAVSAANPAIVVFHGLDHRPWTEAQAALRQVLESRGLAALAAPVTLILHDLTDGALRRLHRRVFAGILSDDLGLDLAEREEQFEALLRTELAEHGWQNLARACQARSLHLGLRFPPPADAHVIVTLELPVPWDDSLCRTAKLVEAVGLRIVAGATDGEASRVHLLRRDERPAAVPAPALMDAAGRLASLDRIAAELGYGLIRFAATGEILDLSPSMLGLLGLDPATASAPELATVIPLAFHSDIVWGLALAEGNGAFENYRIRVRLPGAGEASVLFNVSGFRDADGSIHSLWQAVSREKGTAQLTEGSILSEVRIHNITRNYVPQLVERKARDAVRLGKTALADEERPVAVLFCDIVGFTAYVERHAGDESIIDTLNSILRRVSGSVRRAGGSIDKFMGDCIMALFDDPADAVASAADMQAHAGDINSLRNRAGQQVLQLRIGIHWGEVVIGNVGTAERLDWTAIGDVVNTASRIEKNCPPGEILVSTDVRDAILAKRPDEFVFGGTFGIRVKGKRGETQVCTAAQKGSQ